MPLRNELQQQIVAKHQLEEEPSFTRSPPLSINPSVIQFKGTLLPVELAAIFKSWQTSPASKKTPTQSGYQPSTALQKPRKRGFHPD